MSVISSGTTLTTALVQTGDTNGNLVFKTGASGTTALTLGADQSVTFSGAVSFSSSAFGLGSAASPSITFTGDTNTGIYSPAADTIAFTEGGVESMRIDSSGNVGIGTSSPNAPLSIAKNGTGAYTEATWSNTNSTASLAIGVAGSLVGVSAIQNNAYLYNTGNSAMVFGTNNTERMRIDSSGNVAVGTNITASAAGGGLSFTVGNGTGNPAVTLYSASNGASQISFADATSGAGAYDGYLLYNQASQYMAMGTGGGSERMRIDSSGNVGIGVSSIDAKLDISGGGSTSSAIALTNNDNATISARYSLVFQADRNNNIGGRSFDWKFGGKGYTDGTTQMYLTQAGNLAFNSGYGSAAVAYGCRAWVNFNGTGTVAIRASGNVSSITDDGEGIYTINFSTAMPDANYAIVGSVAKDENRDVWVLGAKPNNSSSAYIQVNNSSGGVLYAQLKQDLQFVQVAIFR